MRRKRVLLCLALALSSCLSMSALAQDEAVSSADGPEQASRVKALQQVIDEQQRQLDAQQTQLDTQKKNLRQFRRQLQELDAGPAAPNASMVEKTAVAHAIGIPSRRNDLQTNRRDDSQSHDDWQGSFGVQGTETRIKIGGFLQLDVIHDTSAIQSKGQFIPDSIATRNATKKDGSDGQTNFSVSPSRLYVETRTPVNQKRVKTFLSIDMFDDELEVDARPRLRQAYVELSDILFGGDLLIGQAWSTTTDLESAPDVLDFRGVDGLFGELQPQIRWTRQVATGVKLMLAAETAGEHIIVGADSLTRLPDLVIATTWDRDNFYLMASLLAKDLRASSGNGPTETAVGFGGSLSGKVKLPFGRYKNNILFSATYGNGIGSHFQNSKPDAVYDSSDSSFEILKAYAVMLSYEHGWKENLSSLFTYCCIELDNDDALPPESIQDTEYTSGNLVWDVNSHWLLGVEGIWGSREDKDEEEGDNFRTQFTSRLSF